MVPRGFLEGNQGTSNIYLAFVFLRSIILTYHMGYVVSMSDDH